MKTSLHRKFLSLLLITLMFISPLTIHAEADTEETTTEAIETTEETTVETTQESSSETTAADDSDEGTDIVTEESTTVETTAAEITTQETTEPQEDVIPELEPASADIPGGIFYLQQREKITVEPDYAEIELGVSTRNEDFATAVSEAKTAAEALKTALLASSAVQIEVENLHFQVWNEQDYNQAPPVIRNYVPRQMYKVTVHDVEQVGTVLDMAIQAGSNELGSINFKSTEEEAKTLEVRKLALEVLDEKAERLVKAMATEEAASTLQRYDVNYSTLKPGLRTVEFETAETSTMAMRNTAADGMGAGAPVSPGLLELEFIVHASYTFGDTDIAQAVSGHLPQVSIDGDATFAVKPDTFRVVFGKDTISVNSAKEAVAENDATFKTLTEELKALGITEDQLQTTQYSVNPYHTYNTEYPEVAGFTVSHYMELVIPADENIKAIMDSILASDLSIVQEGYYYLDDQTVIRQEISVQAARAAHTEFTKLDDREPQAVIVTELPETNYYYSSYGPTTPDRTSFDIVNDTIPTVELSEYVKVDFILDK